ncbi:Cytosolic iron-sulfur protein assembly protein [Coemansia sp. BCRC 34301]|nr:Cytosolic iron-sulfur protein assembly protein [Coemansia sp. BCRC 34301]
MLKLVAELQGHEDRVWQVSWDPSGTRLASCSGDKSARVWSAVSGASFFTTAHATTAMDVDDGGSSLKTTATWQCLDVIDNAHKRTVRSVAFEPTQGRAIATASFDGSTAIWEKTDGSSYECVATLEGHENEAKCVAWAPSGQLLATCGRDKSVWIWESNGEGDFDCISVLMEHTQDVKMVLWHPSQELLASFSYDDTIRVWKEDDDDWVSAATISGHTSTVWSGAFSPQGEYLASVSDDRTVRVWAQNAKKDQSSSEEGFYYRPDTSYSCVAVVPDSVHSRAIYSVSWCASPVAATTPVEAASAEQSAKADLGYLATGSGDNSVRILSVSRKEGKGGNLDIALVCSQENAHGLSDINCVQWNPKFPGWLATSGDDGVVRIWHLEL